tara:strand:- start:1391 stop:1819 length:429 start_codon:yes stop_codon:yes gene_type:complete
MPLRSFGCEECEFEWDELVPMEGTAESCPNCGATKIKQMITGAPAVRKPEYEWSSHDKKEVQIKTLGDRHATEMTVGYAPKEDTAFNAPGSNITHYREYEKSVSVLHKEDYDPRERKYKEKKEIEKIMKGPKTFSMPSKKSK